VWRGLASDLMMRGSASNKTKISCTSRKNSRIEEISFKQKTHRGHRENQLVEGAVRPVQSALQGVAHRDLLVILGIIAGLESGRPQGAGELEGLGFTAHRAR
jgi:hypothetical protein